MLWRTWLPVFVVAIAGCCLYQDEYGRWRTKPFGECLRETLLGLLFYDPDLDDPFYLNRDTTKKRTRERTSSSEPKQHTPPSYQPYPYQRDAESQEQFDHRRIDE